MKFLRDHREPRLVYRIVAAGLVVGGVFMFGTSAAFGAAVLTVSSPNGLAQGQLVTVSGTGFTPKSYGYVLECNEAPNEPTLTIGAPFNQLLPVGCSPPSLKHITNTGVDGSLSTTFQVHVSRKLGPPCGMYTVLAGCPPFDSGSLRPRADAQNYPCPPSPSQQAAGVTCDLIFFDSAHERVSAAIGFLGGGPPPKVPPGGGGVPPGTTPPTTKPTTTTTTPHTVIPPTTTTTLSTISKVTPAIGTIPHTTTPAVVKAVSKSLAFTGLGTSGIVLAVLGGLMVMIGLVLYFVDTRKLVTWLVGH